MNTRNQSTQKCFFYTHWHAFVVIHTHTAHTPCAFWEISGKTRKKKNNVRIHHTENPIQYETQPYAYTALMILNRDQNACAFVLCVPMCIWVFYGCYFIVCMIIFNVTFDLGFYWMYETESLCHKTKKARQTTNQNQRNSRVHDTACRTTAPEKES